MLHSLDDLLSSPRPDHAIQDHIIELLGYEHFELVAEIIQNRIKVAQEVRHERVL